MIAEVEKIFDQAIKEKLKTKPDVLTHVLNHERKQACLEKLCYQIKLIEIRLTHFTALKYKDTIQSVAHMFAAAALNHLQQRVMSENEKKRQIAEADRMKQIEAEFAEDQKHATSTATKVFT